MNVTYRDGRAQDAPTLDSLFDESFTATFGHLYAAEDLHAFLSRFGPAAWEEEIADPDFAFRVAEVDGAMAGFAKISSVSLPVTPAGRAAELRQLYLRGAWHGVGIAQVLMDWAIATAQARGAEELYLSVFTENHRARAFYDRNGFEPVGPTIFMVGNHADEDVIMRKAL